MTIKKVQSNIGGAIATTLTLGAGDVVAVSMRNGEPGDGLAWSARAGTGGTVAVAASVAEHAEADDWVAHRVHPSIQANTTIADLEEGVVSHIRWTAAGSPAKLHLLGRYGYALHYTGLSPAGSMQERKDVAIGASATFDMADYFHYPPGGLTFSAVVTPLALPGVGGGNVTHASSTIFVRDLVLTGVNAGVSSVVVTATTPAGATATAGFEVVVR